MRRRTLMGGIAALALPASAASPLRVVASFTILADLVRQIGGDRVQVSSLVGPEQDMHVFDPRASDVQAVGRGDVMVINGLGLEPWAERLAKAAGFKGRGVVASRGVAALKAGHRHGAESGAAHTHGAEDPHAWQDVANVKLYAANIRDGLTDADPAGAAAYATATTTLLDRLTALEVEIRGAFLAIPRAARTVVTSHEAFSYYGDAYDIDFLAPQGLTTAGEPTPRQIAALVAQIRARKVRALFIEKLGRSPLLAQVARETGVRIGGELYSDALSAPGGPAATYEAMMRHNTRMIAEALRA
jgi:zinc/manganese transport system substrate-binding protein